MNIIKLKDIKLDSSIGISQEEVDLFNNHLKGKYAYWIQMRYIVSFDHMKHEGYLACEEDITKLLKKSNGTYPKPYGAPNIDIYDWMDKLDENGEHVHIEPEYYVDMIETDRINNTIEYRLKNEFTPDSDITIDELKQFRTWLAKTMLRFDQTDFDIYGEEILVDPDGDGPMPEKPVLTQKYNLFDDKETHMLQYYANGMYDSTIKILSDFGNSQQVFFNTSNGSNCGCSHGSTDLSSLYNSSLTVCDPIVIYKDNIYKYMVSLFSDTNFWVNKFKTGNEFFLEFKKYIDNIIKINLPLISTSNESIYTDCGCGDKSKQQNLMDILKRLSESLGYIYNNQLTGHKNFIKDALTDWSVYLYEKMYWN